MIQCDLWNQWYHYECMGTSADEAAKIDFACPAWIMHMKDLICYCTCIVSRSMQSSSYLLSSYLGLVSYLSPLLLSVCSVSFMNHALNEEKSLVKSIIISCQKFFCVLIGCLTNVMSKKMLAVAFSVLPEAYTSCHLCGISMVGSGWLHILSMLISLCLLTLPLFVQVTYDGNLTRLSAVWLRETVL